MMKHLLYILAIGLLFIPQYSCLKDEMYKGPATINEITFSPTTVTPDDQVVVSIKTSDLKGITSAKISYTVNGTAQADINMAENPTFTFTGSIPKQADKAVVKFIVSVLNKSGFTTSTVEKIYTVGAIPPDFSNLVLNEIDGNSKTIELFNKGAKAIPLVGVTLTKNNTAVWWTGTAAAGNIAAGGYVQIVQGNSDPNFAGASGISNKQSLKFELKDPGGASRGIFLRGDEGTLGGTISDISPKSYQRIPNGTGDWKLAAPTTGAANAANGDNIPQN